MTQHYTDSPWRTWAATRIGLASRLPLELADICASYLLPEAMASCEDSCGVYNDGIMRLAKSWPDGRTNIYHALECPVAPGLCFSCGHFVAEPMAEHAPMCTFNVEELCETPEICYDVPWRNYHICGKPNRPLSRYIRNRIKQDEQARRTDKKTTNILGISMGVTTASVIVGFAYIGSILRYGHWPKSRIVLGATVLYGGSLIGAAYLVRKYV
jgi:hypothetical protein